MNDNEQVPEKEKSVVLDKIIEIDSLKPNSVVIFRVLEPNKAMISAIQNFVNLYGDILQEKQCSLLVLGKDAQLEVLDETEMNKAGWEKKEKSRIIIPS